MEAIQTPVLPQIANHGGLNSNTMDNDMDIDMDLDIGPVPEAERIELETASIVPVATTGQVDEPQLEKVHIRGVDELTTDDIKRFAMEHFTLEEPQKIEWIDDTSANIVYSTAEIGLKALFCLTQENIEEAESSSPAIRLRAAKSLSTHPDSVIQVRSAVKTDRKKHRAYEASRFYLMHPEHDPRERVRKEFAGRRSSSGRRDGNESGYTRRRFDDREHRRRKSLDRGDRFDVNMYDDEQPSSNEADQGKQKGNDLFAGHTDRSKGRLRDRSASPSRSKDDSSFSMSSSRRFRDRPRLQDRHGADHVRRNTGRELFSSGANSSDEHSNRRELFPNKSAATYLKKELFQTKSSSNANASHRRSDAFDAADETMELFAKRMSVPFVDGADSSANPSVELFPESTKATDGFNIRGSSVASQGISIRGGASNGLSIKGAASVRELFPSKYSGNQGKELFSDKLEGRGGSRRKAEDMFY
ncbi:hypothetical protein FQN57_001996 [Myotisia sp. PD_48]|nr:hypothetical protein FQN57_001996 [Myotisia sp. PD_48]